MTALDPIRRGDRRQVLLWAFRPDGTREILSDKHLWFTAKRRHRDADADAVLRKGTAGTGLTGIAVTVVPADPPDAPGAGGEVAVVSIDAADTADLPSHGVLLYWDGQIAAPGVDPQTPEDWHGTLLVEPDVTRAGTP